MLGVALGWEDGAWETKGDLPVPRLGHVRGNVLYLYGLRDAVHRFTRGYTPRPVGAVVCIVWRPVAGGVLILIADVFAVGLSVYIGWVSIADLIGTV